MLHKPVKDRLIVKVIEKKRESNIIIPETVKPKENMLECQVMSVGEGRRDASGNPVPVEAKVGDVVIIGIHIGIPVTIDEKEYRVIREDDILCIKGDQCLE